MTQITESSTPPTPPLRPLWVVGSGDDERGRGSAPGPCCQGSPQDETERGSVTLGGPAGPTWTLLSPAARVFTTNQTP